MIKTVAIFFVVIFSLSLVGCKSHEQAAQACKQVMQGLDKCVDHRVDSASCDMAVKSIKQSLKNTGINNYNILEWGDSCKRLCVGTYDYRPVVRGNYEQICHNSEIFNIKDDRFIKLAALTGIWLVGCIVLFFGLIRTWRVRRFRKECIKTKGVVTGHESSHSDGSTIYAPVIEFKDWMGRTHQFTAKMFTSTMNQPSEEVGSTVKVIYPKDKPDQVRYDTFISLWLLPIFLLVWGGGFVLISGVSLFSAKEWRNHHGYLQQHAPAVAEAADEFARAIRESVPVLTKISNYRIIEERPGHIVIEADYRLSPFQDDKIYMGAITMTDGRSGGEWGYRPAQLQKGFGTARVRLGATRKHCSNQIKLSIYRGGKGKIYQRVIPYEKCWEKAGS